MSNDSVLEELYRCIGHNILHFRTEKGLTQEELAAKLYMEQPSISKYERCKKKIDLDKINDFAKFFDVPLNEFMFKDFQREKKVEERQDNKVSLEGPIQKCSNRTYFCYYIKEQFNKQSGVVPTLALARIKILKPETSHSAKVQVVFENSTNKRIIEGDLTMDESYAYIKAHDLLKDFFFELIFYYYRNSSTPIYKGGAALLQRIDRHDLPICQFGVLSANEIAEKKHSKVEQLLMIDKKDDASLSKRQYSSSSILRLTKSKDKEIFEWLRGNTRI